jgi:hypothetical protein
VRLPVDRAAGRIAAPRSPHDRDRGAEAVDRKLVVSDDWAIEHGLRQRAARGPMEVLRTDGEVYLQALAFLGASSYTHVRLVEATT